jgi:PilZ domain-containing protein
MDERRSVSRQKSFLQGRIYFNNRCTTVDCLIRDFSENGARLKFDRMISIPDMVELFIPVKDETRRAKIIWRNADEVGVSFNLDEGSPSLVPGIPQADWGARILKLEHDIATLQRKLNELQKSMRYNEPP